MIMVNCHRGQKINFLVTMNVFLKFGLGLGLRVMVAVMPSKWKAQLLVTMQGNPYLCNMPIDDCSLEADLL